jgi:inosose dehydratase
MVCRARGAARAVRDAAGLRTVFHHHCAGYVDAGGAEALMSLTDLSLIGLCLDTGHLTFGGGDPIAAIEKQRSHLARASQRL